LTSDFYTRDVPSARDRAPARDRQPARDVPSAGNRQPAGDRAPARDRQPARGGRAQPIGSGFTVVAVLSIAATAALLISALVYYLGSPGRIASDYTSLASPANRALSADLAGYAKNRNSDLAAAKSDLTKEARTISSFNVMLQEVTFPTAAASASQSLIFADDRLHKLIQQQAEAHSLREMRALEAGANAAAANVKVKVAAIRGYLGLPPASGTLY
jgi:hypothetical protein